LKNSPLNDLHLPDFIDHGLRCLSIGLNPSILSAKCGFYFANPRNRFWSAFNQSEIVKETLPPGVASQYRLLDVYKMGFTDVVKRPSRMANELRADDYRQEAPLLREKIEQYAPEMLWFHGKMAANNYFKYAFASKPDVSWGLNDFSQYTSLKVFVTPNPSPANAKFSVSDLVAYYEKIKLNIY
jgi:TDG/mug DNA glycosylase family protein